MFKYLIKLPPPTSTNNSSSSSSSNNHSSSFSNPHQPVNSIELNSLLLKLNAYHDTKDKTDLLVRIYNSYIIIDNGKKVIVLDHEKSETQILLQRINDGRFSNEITSILERNEIFFQRDEIVIKILDLRNSSKNNKAYSMEKMKLYRENGDLYFYVRKWVNQNFSHERESEKLLILSTIINHIYQDKLFLKIQVNGFVEKSNYVNYSIQKNNFRRKKKVIFLGRKYPFVDKKFKGIFCPFSKAQFIYPHNLYKYIVKTQLYEKYLDKGKRKKKQQKKPIIDIKHKQQKDKDKIIMMINTTAKDKKDTSSNGNGNSNGNSNSNSNSNDNDNDNDEKMKEKKKSSWDLEDYFVDKSKKDYNNNGGSIDVTFNHTDNLNMWVRKFGNYPINKSVNLHPNRMRVLTFKDLNGLVWTFEIVTFVENNRICYMSKVINPRKKVLSTCKLTSRRSYELYVERVKNIFVGKGILLFDSIVDRKNFKEPRNHKTNNNVERHAKNNKHTHRVAPIIKEPQRIPEPQRIQSPRSPRIKASPRSPRIQAPISPRIQIQAPRNVPLSPILRPVNEKSGNRAMVRTWFLNHKNIYPTGNVVNTVAPMFQQYGKKNTTILFKKE